MKIVKLSNHSFLDIDWQMPKAPKRVRSEELNSIATEHEFFGYPETDADSPTIMYQAKVYIGENGKFRIIAVGVINNLVLMNNVYEDIESFKNAIVKMGIAPRVLGMTDNVSGQGPQEFRLTKSRDDLSPPMELIIRVEPHGTLYSIPYTVTNISSGEKVVNSQYIRKGIKEFSYKEAMEVAKRMINTAIQTKGYHPPNSDDYIEAGSSSRLVMSQDYGGYYSGAAPEYQGSLIGSPNVDLTNLSGQFGDAQKSVDLVNRFDPNLLQNIVYMFNFSKSGVYGVYVPALDREVKTKELQKRLEQMGYEIVEEDGMLRAYPTKEQKDSATIESEIQTVYNDLEGKGGSVLGLNINDTRNEVEQSFNNIQEMVDPDRHAELRNDLMIAHMAATMAHEATHAHGHKDEAMPTQVETALLNNALEEIRQKYNIEGELGLKRGSSSNWYKEAQTSQLYAPVGSDLQGRHGNKGGDTYEGQGDFGLMAQQFSNRAIEEMLGNQFQSPLPYDLSQEHDVYELQLRKYDREGFSLNPKLIFDELLRDGRTEDGRAYKTMEELLEESRPQPLMMPIKKASKMVKEATIFGWMNNLEISDGSTIPGMGDRVMAWDDRDESFSEYEGWIKAQPRYNPSYDIKGFYYRWIEPRFKPETWDNFTSDLSNTHPAKRFASRNDLGFIIDSLRKIRSQLLDVSLPATRFICSEDMLMIIDKCMSDSDIDIEVFVLGEINGEEIYACWIHRDVDSASISVIEKAIQENDDRVPELMDDVLGCQPTLSEAVSNIMETVEAVCHEYDIVDVVAVGSYAREVSLGDSYPEVEELEFTSDGPSSCLKTGYLVAEELGVKPRLDKKHKCVCFNYKGVQVSFNGGERIEVIDRLMDKVPLPESGYLIHDVCNKDFTINMRTYSPYTGGVTSWFGEEMVVKTLFDADHLVSINPFIILRALYLSVRHNLPIDEELEKAIKKYSPVLVKKYPVERLRFAKAKIESMGKEEAQELFQKYELDCILELGD
jgi:hypothetical protein